MTFKHSCYHTLALRLSLLWERDALMSEHDPARWQEARDLDDWLIHYGGWTILLEKEEFATLYQDHTTVSNKEYRAKCVDMQTLYDTWEYPAAGRLGEASR